MHEHTVVNMCLLCGGSTFGWVKHYKEKRISHKKVTENIKEKYMTRATLASALWVPTHGP